MNMHIHEFCHWVFWREVQVHSPYWGSLSCDAVASDKRKFTSNKIWLFRNKNKTFFMEMLNIFSLSFIPILQASSLSQSSVLPYKWPWYGLIQLYSNTLLNAIHQVRKCFNIGTESKAQLQYTFHSLPIKCHRHTSNPTSRTLFYTQGTFMFKTENLALMFWESYFKKILNIFSSVKSALIIFWMDYWREAIKDTKQYQKGNNRQNTIAATFNHNLSLIVLFAITEQTMEWGGK